MKKFLILLAIVALGAFIWKVSRKSSYEPSLQPTYRGDPFAYAGNKTLVVAVYAGWASVWTAATESELAKLDMEKYDLCLVSADNDREMTKRLGADIVPTVFVFRDGKVAESFPNLMSVEAIHGRK